MLWLKSFLLIFDLNKERKRTYFINQIPKLSLDELITIIEENKQDKDVTKTCIKALANFKSKEVLKAIENYWKIFIRNNFKNILINKTLPKSLLINEKQMKRLINKVKIQLEKNHGDLGNATPSGWDI